MNIIDFNILIDVLNNNEGDVNQITEQINVVRECISSLKCIPESNEYCRFLDSLLNDFISKKYSDINNTESLKLVSKR